MSEASAADLPIRCGLAATNLTDAGRPDLDPEEDLAATFDAVTLMLGLENQGEGQLFVTTRRVIWARSAGDSAYGVHFTSLVIHAVASASEEFPRDNIYIQLDGPESVEDDTQDSTPEVRLVPSDESTVASIFQALCEGAAANPDSDMEDDEGDFFFDQDEINQGAAKAEGDGHAEMLDRFDAMLQAPSNGAASIHPNQFEDADSSSEDGHGCPCHPRR